MAMKDRIGLDAVGMAANHLEAMKKGLAHHFSIKDYETGALDISDPADLLARWKEEKALELRLYANDAQAYERAMVTPEIDISDA